jgi:hypothetical protein
MTNRSAQRFTALLLANDDSKCAAAARRVMESFWAPRNEVALANASVIDLAAYRLSR